MNQTICDVKRRQDFVLLFDVTDGNPNGDPDAGNLPRVDPETMHGLVTDVCLKRKVRDFVDATRGTEASYKIFVQRERYLYEKQRGWYDQNKVDSKNDKRMRDARTYMCANFFDVRLFGAVMSTKEYNCGQVRGPVQLTFGRSVDPIVPLDLCITRVALTHAGEKPERTEDTEEMAPGHGTMGRKALVPYGLYRSHGFFNPKFAEATGATPEDLEVFWQALQQMWDLDRSSARGMMACRGLYVFSHENALGNAPAHALFERIRVQRKDAAAVARSFSDYRVEVKDADMPPGIALTRLVD
jgi:CRISPR-associated protein Csd2